MAVFFSDDLYLWVVLAQGLPWASKMEQNESCKRRVLQIEYHFFCKNYLACSVLNYGVFSVTPG